MAIILRPRGDDWLEDEIIRAKRSGINTLVSLLEENEAVELGLAEEGVIANDNGLAFVSFPIPDRHVPPNTASFRIFVVGLANRLSSGDRIGVHCRGSIGRATVTAACTLIHLGWTPRRALAEINPHGVARFPILPSSGTGFFAMRQSHDSTFISRHLSA